MSYKSLQEGAAIGNAFMQFGLTYRDVMKDQKEEEFEKKVQMHAIEFEKNAKARQAEASDPSFVGPQKPEHLQAYSPKAETPEDAMAIWQGGLLYTKKKVEEANADTTVMENVVKKRRARLNEIAGRFRAAVAINDPEEKMDRFKDIYNDLPTGNKITDISDDGTATVENYDGETRTMKITTSMMYELLDSQLSDPQEAMAREVKDMKIIKDRNAEILGNPVLLEKETEAGNEYAFEIKGLVDIETRDPVPTYYTREPPPNDFTKLSKKEQEIVLKESKRIVLDRKKWRVDADQSAETPTEKKVKDLGIQQLQQGLDTSKQAELTSKQSAATSAASEKKIIQETANLKNVPAAKQEEADLKAQKRKVELEKATIEYAKTDMGYSEQFGLNDEKSDGFKLFTKTTSLLLENVDFDKTTPAKAFTSVKEIIDAAEKYADDTLKKEDKKDDPEGYKAKKNQLMNEFVEYSLRGAQEEAPEAVDPQKLVEASKAAPPTKTASIGDRLKGLGTAPKKDVPQPTAEELNTSPMQNFLKNAGGLSSLEKRKRMEEKKKRDIGSFIRKPPALR